MSVVNRDFNPSKSPEVDAIKQGFRDLELQILKLCPEGRRRSVALTHLETAAMFAVKSVFEP